MGIGDWGLGIGDWGLGQTNVLDNGKDRIINKINWK